MVKHVYEVPEEFLNRFDSRLGKIEGALQKINALERPEEFTPKEFMSRIKISRSQLEIFMNLGLIKYKKIGRKIYIPDTEVERYFAGEIKLSK